MYFLLIIFIRMNILPSASSYTSHLTPETTPEREHFRAFKQLFDAGQRNYANEEWTQCTDNILSALEDFHEYTSYLVQCRAYCFRSKNALVEDDFLLAMRTAIEKANCLRQCWAHITNAERTAVSKETLETFVTLKPYAFLHICAFKSGNAKLAASAAYTNYLANKNDNVMLNNIYFYRKVVGISNADFVNMEENAFVAPYFRAAEAYSDGLWFDVIVDMETAVREFYSDYHRCEALCEGPDDVLKGLLTFHELQAEQYIAVLRCYDVCFTKLTTVRGKVMVDVLSDMYNYLQFAYFKVGRLNEALEAVESFLVFKPGHEDMMLNKAFYRRIEGAEPASPRQEALLFHVHMSQVSTLLSYVDEQYTTYTSQTDQQFKFPPNFSAKKRFDQYRAASATVPTTPTAACPAPLPPTAPGAAQSNSCPDAIAATLGVDTVDDYHRRLTGRQLVTYSQADTLSSLAMLHGLRKGYEDQFPSVDRSHAHAASWEKVREISFDLDIKRAAELYKIGKVTWDDLYLWLNTTEKVKTAVDQVLNTDTETQNYVYESRLVCRQIKPGPTGAADSPCARQEGGACYQRGAYQNTSFLAVVHLTANYTGGQLVVENFKKNSKVTYAPTVGEFHAFSSFNSHSVTPLLRGTRCVLYVAFTRDKQQRNLEYILALNSVKCGPKAGTRAGTTLQTSQRWKNAVETKDGDDRESIKEEYAGKGIRVRELDIWARFTADGLADEGQCRTLMDLATVAAQKNDGYTAQKDLGTVHTEHEYFSGITIDGAAELAAKSRADVSAVRMYQNLSEVSKNIVERYFQMPTPLYFDFTHLVCRTAKNDSNVDRDDLSHPIHSDNCIVYADGSCRKEAPAYVERDYSAVLYLNDDFEGGEFVFTSPKPVAIDQWRVEAEVKPRCGRLVAFRASDLHGVRAVLSGRRCAVAMWYTLDPYYREKAHGAAKRILSKLDQKAAAPGA